MSLKFTTVANFDFEGEDYRKLFSRSCGTAFQHPIWLKHLFAHLLDGAKPVILCGYSNEGTLSVVIPLVMRRLYGLRLLEAPNFGVSDYVAPIILNSARESLIQDSLVPRQIASVLPSHDILRIKHVPADNREVWKLLFPSYWEEHKFQAHDTLLSADYTSWRSANLTDSFRRYLDRKKKRLLRLGTVCLTEISDPLSLRQTIECIADVRQGRFNNDMLQIRAVRNFYAAVAAEGAPEGLVKIYTLTLDGEELGRTYCLSHDGRFHFLLMGCDYKRHGRHSPGLIFFDMLIERRIGYSDTVFDFTIGDEPYKKDFGTTPKKIFFSEKANTSLGSAVLKVRRLMGRMREYVLHRKPMSEPSGHDNASVREE